MKIENSERRLQISIWARNGPKYADSPGCGWPSKEERDLCWSTRQGRDVSESSQKDLSFDQILSKETFLHPTSLSEMVLWVRKKFNTHWYIEDGNLLSYFFIKFKFVLRPSMWPKHSQDHQRQEKDLLSWSQTCISIFDLNIKSTMLYYAKYIQWQLVGEN